MHQQHCYLFFSISFSLPLNSLEQFNRIPFFTLSWPCYLLGKTTKHCIQAKTLENMSRTTNDVRMRAHHGEGTSVTGFFWFCLFITSEELTGCLVSLIAGWARTNHPMMIQSRWYCLNLICSALYFPHHHKLSPFSSHHACNPYHQNRWQPRNYRLSPTNNSYSEAKPPTRNRLEIATLTPVNGRRAEKLTKRSIFCLFHVIFAGAVTECLYVQFRQI